MALATAAPVSALVELTPVGATAATSPGALATATAAQTVAASPTSASGSGPGPGPTSPTGSGPTSPTGSGPTSSTGSGPGSGPTSPTGSGSGTGPASGPASGPTSPTGSGSGTGPTSPTGSGSGTGPASGPASGQSPATKNTSEKNQKNKKYKCNDNGKNKDKPTEDSKPDFPYNLYTKPPQNCNTDTCKTTFLTWWQNMFAYSVFNTNKWIRLNTRKIFKNPGKYSIIESDTAFYLLFVFYFIGGLICSSFSGIIYLIMTLFIEPDKVKYESGIIAYFIPQSSPSPLFDWSPFWWVLFNIFPFFWIIFIIMILFTIFTITQYIFNFTIKPLMNNPDDIKEILKCNVHTLILFFCGLTIFSSSQYLDDVSTIVMSVVTLLYLIRTTVLYIKDYTNS